MFSNRFNTKNDPLLGAIEEAMQDGAIRRQAEAFVNEEFGVYSRKAVVREHLADYDAALEEAYKCMKEGEKEPKLDMKAREKDKSDYSKMREKMVGKGKDAETTRKIVGEAKKLADKDYDKDGKVESPKDEVWGSRFRAAKMAGKMEEEEQIDEISKELAGRYIKKADYKRSDSSFQSGKVYGKELATKRRTKQDVETARGHNRDAYKREKGINTAVDKLTGRAKVQAREETDYSAPDRAAVTRDNKPSTPAQTNAATSGPSAADKAALTSKIKSMNEAAYSAKAARAGKDIGKPGKEFKKIAKSAAERYGSEERGKKVAGAILKKIRAKHMKEENLEELSAFGKAFAAAKGQNFTFGGKQYSGAMKGQSSASRPSSTPGTQGVATGKSFSAIDKAQSAKERSGPADNPALRNAPGASTMGKTPGSVARDTGITGKPGGETGVKSGSTVSLDRPGNPGATPGAAPAPAPKPNAPSTSAPSSAPAGARSSASSGLVGPDAGKMMTANRPAPVTSQPGAPKDDASASVKKLMSMNESVQVGANRYRIV